MPAKTLMLKSVSAVEECDATKARFCSDDGNIKSFNALVSKKPPAFTTNGFISCFKKTHSIIRYTFT